MTNRPLSIVSIMAALMGLYQVYEIYPLLQPPFSDTGAIIWITLILMAGHALIWRFIYRKLVHILWFIDGKHRSALTPTLSFGALLCICIATAILYAHGTTWLHLPHNIVTMFTLRLNVAESALVLMLAIFNSLIRKPAEL